MTCTISCQSKPQKFPRMPSVLLLLRVWSAVMLQIQSGLWYNRRELKAVYQLSRPRVDSSQPEQRAQMSFLRSEAQTSDWISFVWKNIFPSVPQLLTTSAINQCEAVCQGNKYHSSGHVLTLVLVSVYKCPLHWIRAPQNSLDVSGLEFPQEILQLWVIYSTPGFKSLISFCKPFHSLSPTTTLLQWANHSSP